MKDRILIFDRHLGDIAEYWLTSIMERLFIFKIQIALALEYLSAFYCGHVVLMQIRCVRTIGGYSITHSRLTMHLFNVMQYKN